MKTAKWALYLQIGFWLAALGGILAIAFNFSKIAQWVIDKIFGKNTTAATAAFWKNKLGLLPPGTPIPDSTGTLGQDISDASQAAATAATSPQLDYNRARSAYMKARGLSPAWDDPKAAGWAWDSYDDWVGAGTPPLQASGL